MRSVHPWAAGLAQLPSAFATDCGDSGIVERRPESSERAVALSATIYAFDITLNDADRSVYESLSFRVARHPSETEEYLLTRVIAYCLEYTRGIQFSKGLSEPDMPALSVRDLTGALLSWIDIGTPDAERLHKAAKASRRVVVYAHRDVAPLLAKLAAEPVHRAENIEIYAVDRSFLAALAARLDRRMSFDLAVADRHLYLSLGDETLAGIIERHRISRVM